MTHCQSCKISILAHINYCPSCGNAIKKKVQSTIHHHLNLIIAFYVVTILFFIGVYLVTKNGEGSLQQEILIECISALIVIGFVSIDYRNIIQLYKIPKIAPLVYLAVFLAPIITAFTVYYGIEIINDSLFNDSSNYYAAYTTYENPMIWATLFIVILPPIFEELAFRGFLFNQLQKVTSTNITIILTAFIFALVHFSVVSLLWIFPFGLLLGYVRHKYNTLWLGMIIHFIHNLIVLSLDYYYYNSTFDSILNL